MKIMKHSWTFNGIDMRDEFGLILEEPFNDRLKPRLRERKLIVPHRDGAYDYGAKYYDERDVGVKCASAGLSRSDVRRLALVLSEKGELRSWYEPDKYYVGRIYEDTDIERIVGNAKRFVLPFVCDPFAYGEQVTVQFKTQAPLAYRGSAATPTHIIITNRTQSPIKGLTLTMRESI